MGYVLALLILLIPIQPLSPIHPVEAAAAGELGQFSGQQIELFELYGEYKTILSGPLIKLASVSGDPLEGDWFPTGDWSVTCTGYRAGIGQFYIDGTFPGSEMHSTSPGYVSGIISVRAQSEGVYEVNGELTAVEDSQTFCNSLEVDNYGDDTLYYDIYYKNSDGNIDEHREFSLLLGTGNSGQTALDLFIPSSSTEISIYRLDGTPIEEGSEESPGAMVFLNNDNDDSDGLIDNDASENGVPGEDDLIKFTASPSGPSKLSVTQGAEKIRMWDNAEKIGQPISLPINISEKKTYYMEGVAASGAAGDVVLTLQKNDQTPTTAKTIDTVKVSVVSISKISFSGIGNSINGNDVLDSNAYPNPTAAFGVRVFPESTLLIDPSGTSAVLSPPKDKVKVNVDLNVPVPYETSIFLKSFDIDDPSSQVLPIDDESMGADNLGETPNVSASGNIDGEDADGIARITFAAFEKIRSTQLRITMQPGDNFKIAGHNDRDFLMTLRNEDQLGDGIDIKVPNPLLPAPYQSNELTVWRKIHVEADTMQQPPRTVSLSRDDTRTVLPKLPNISAINKYYDDAYILVVTDLSALDKKDGLTFDNNLEGPDTIQGSEIHSLAANAPCIEKKDLSFSLNTNAYWTSYITSAFEGPVIEDNDPDGENWLAGVTAILDPEDSNCGIIFQETIRDLASYRATIFGSKAAKANGYSVEGIEAWTVAHELGHQLLGPGHPVEGMMSEGGYSYVDQNGNGKYDKGIDSIIPLWTSFSASDLILLRDTKRIDAIQ